MDGPRGINDNPVMTVLSFRLPSLPFSPVCVTMCGHLPIRVLLFLLSPEVHPPYQAPPYRSQNRFRDNKNRPHTIACRLYATPTLAVSSYLGFRVEGKGLLCFLGFRQYRPHTAFISESRMQMDDYEIVHLK